jgi:tetratricopeptide (TPR) repeat protein
MKIAVYAISKNEESFVNSFCESAKEADLIVIADTGSNDSTVQLAKNNNATVYEISVSPWRFDKARDCVLALLPSDIDICVSLDLDETLQPGWRQEIERVWTEHTTRLRYLYDWGSGIVFHTDKIHARHGYHWHHPCHETLRADSRIIEKWATTDKLLIVHNPDLTKSRGQYLDLLEMSVLEDPLCPRNAFYYARELFFYGHWTKAIEALNSYLKNPNSKWVSERAAAMTLLSACNTQLGNQAEALKWNRLACAESPNEKEPWFGLATQSYAQQDWLTCYTSCLIGMNIGEYEKTYLSNPQVNGSQFFDLAAIAAYHLGKPQESVEYGTEALRLDPDNKRLFDNLEFYKSLAKQ